MLWNILFAHFLADYPLQSNWMAANKNRSPVLLLHTAIHLVTMLLVSGSAAAVAWPYLLLLATIHLGIDTLKNFISARRRDWANFLYLADQGLHILSIVAVAAWVEQSGAAPATLLDSRLAIFATGLLLTTYVWFISERILARRDADYVEEVIKQRWSRMAARALLWVGLLWLVTPRALLPIGLAGGLPWPYLSGKHAHRAILTDLLVVLCILFWVQWALRTA